ncbi:MAG: amidohydrolase family protein [Bryobacterales bacterium]|nr:amidohydrolase family protein [Bryobacterales bacterium]
MAAPLIVRGARQLLTLRESRGSGTGSAKEKLGLLEDGSLLIDQGRIAEVGVWRRIGNLHSARAARQIDASGCLLLPGLIDCFADLFSAPVSPLLIRHRARTLLAHGTTTACSPPPPHQRQIQLARDQGLDVLPVLPGEPTLPLRDFLARRPASWPTGACLGSGFDGHTHLACSMLAAIALASIRGSLPVEDAILSATLGAARRLGLDGQAGSLTPGATADFLLLDVADYRQIPYHLGENLVRAVYKRGEKIYQRGEPYWRGES